MTHTNSAKIQWLFKYDDAWTTEMAEMGVVANGSTNSSFFWIVREDCLLKTGGCIKDRHIAREIRQTHPDFSGEEVMESWLLSPESASVFEFEDTASEVEAALLAMGFKRIEGEKDVSTTSASLFSTMDQ